MKMTFTQTCLGIASLLLLGSCSEKKDIPVIPDSMLLSVLVANDGTDGKSTVSTIMRDGSVIENIRPDGSNFNARISSLNVIHSKIYIVCDDPGRVDVLNLTNFKDAGAIFHRTEQTAFQYIIPAEDNLLAVSDASLRSVFLVNEAKDSITREVSLNRLPGQMTMVGLTLYAAAGDCISSFRVINLDNDKEPPVPEEIAVPARRDSKLMWLDVADNDTSSLKTKMWALSSDALSRIDLQDKEVDRSFSLSAAGIDASTGYLEMSKDKKKIYFNAKKNGKQAVFSLSPTAIALPAEPDFYCPEVVELTDMKMSSRGTFYMADARDGMSRGKVYEYDATGKVLGVHTVGVNPSALFIVR